VFLFRRYRKYSEAKQLTINQRDQANPAWYSDLAATQEEYVYLDQEEETGE